MSTKSSIYKKIKRFDEALAEVQRERSRRTHWTPIERLALVLMVVFPTMALGSRAITIAILVIVSGGFQMLVFARRRSRGALPLKRMRLAARDLAESDSVLAVEALLRASQARDRETRATVLPTLARILPTISATDRGRISPDSIQNLELLVRSENPDLALAALHALRHVGDYASIAALRKIATGRTRLETYAEVTECAASTADAIETRLEGDWRNQLLLRPASEVDKYHLLRAANSSGSEPAEVLLRPTTDQRP